MAASLCWTLPTRVSVEGASASFSGRTPTTSQQVRVIVQNGTTVPFQPLVGCGRRSMRSGRSQGRRIVQCAAASDGGAEGKSSCCGGSGGAEEGQSGGKCSSHGLSKEDATADVSGIGKEFEALLAQKTMQEFEAQYETGQVGIVTRMNSH